MQNSLERLFEGMATGLREDVLPTLEDPYARAQVLAAVELLGNVGARVEWRCADLREEIERIRAVLAASPSPPGILAEPLPQENEALVDSRRRHLEALALLQETGEIPADGMLESFLDWQLERELALLRTGMYR